MGTRLLRMPEVAANAEEAVLRGWAVEVNAPFAAGDVIATVETDKAVVDVEAEADGVLVRTLAQEGATVAAGAPIAVLGEAGAAAARLFSSPLARRLAREAGLPLEEITGTGPNGRIVRRDVAAAIQHRDVGAAVGHRDGEAAIRQRDVEATADRRPPEPAAAAPAAAPAAEPAFAETPHSRARRAIATRLTESKQTIPHFYVRGTADVGKLLKLRRRLNADEPKITLTHLVVKAAALAHRRVPDMNVIWTPTATRALASVDVSVAVATERGGLVTPVIRAADRLTIGSLAATLADLTARAGSGDLRRHELEGGALTVTNLGMYGVEEFAAVINPPQSAILAVGAVRREPVVSKGKLKPAHVMRVTLSADHRPIDGAVAAAWLGAFLDLLANPLRILR